MTPTGARNLSNRLASDQPEQALAVARVIDNPWFRCQALSHVARYWPDDKYVRLLEEAVDAADSQDDVFNCAAVAAWPIRAYLERDNPSAAQKLLTRYTHAASTINNMGSRSEALFTIFQASKPFALYLWQPVFWALVDAAEPVLSWRQQRNLRDAVAMVGLDTRQLVEQTLEKLSNEKNLSIIRRYLAEPRFAEPRQFFGCDRA
jgi:hypothetical protein